MMRFISALAIALLASNVGAAPTIEWLPDGVVVDSLSYDGSAATGVVIEDFSYETFRWTAATGVVRLGRATVPVLGTGAGTPNISYDGTRISSTILTDDSAAMAPGVWSAAAGWTTTMPPLPADCALLDSGYGSAWGLSGNGLMVTGFYWTTAGKAQACEWTQAAGTITLPQAPGRSGRVNAASYDGSVVVGWEEHPDGTWQSRAWRNGVKIQIDNTPAFTSAEGVSGDGSLIVGQTWDPLYNMQVGAIWRWNGASYDMTNVGYLPGTIIGRGQMLLESISNNGRIAVGLDQYRDTSPLTAGAVWTPATGLVYATDYLASLGIQWPDDLKLLEVDAVSPDGSTLAGLGQDDDGVYRPFLVHLGPPCAADVNADGRINTADLGAMLAHFGAFVVPGYDGDTNGDGVVNTADLGAMLSAFGESCS